MKEIQPLTVDTPMVGKVKNLLPPVALTVLGSIQETKVCPKGFEFFLEGQSPLGIYILYAGRVELSVTDIHGRQTVLGLALPGDVLGLSAVVSGKSHEETAEAVVPSQTGFIKGRDFLRFLDHHPEGAFWVVQLLSEQVAATLDQFSCIQNRPFRDIRR